MLLELVAFFVLYSIWWKPIYAKLKRRLINVITLKSLLREMWPEKVWFQPSLLWLVRTLPRWWLYYQLWYPFWSLCPLFLWLRLIRRIRWRSTYSELKLIQVLSFYWKWKLLLWFGAQFLIHKYPKKKANIKKNTLNSRLNF
jgi:hypothetical protein